MKHQKITKIGGKSLQDGTDDHNLNREQRLAAIVAKARINGLTMISPSYMSDLLKNYGEVNSNVIQAAKLVGSGALGVNKILKALGEAIASAAPKYPVSSGVLAPGSNFWTAFPEGWKESMNRTMKKLPDAIILMSEAGWPLDYDVTPAEVVNLADMLEMGRKIEVDLYMTTAIENSLNDIFQTLNGRHSTRVHIFQKILKCFENEMFYVGILGVLSQIDGICNDFTSNDFFRSTNKKPRVTHYLFEQFGQSSNWLLGPIAKIPVLSYDKEHQVEGELNRHLVMHGKDFSYGNKVNFFKSIAWLKYMSDVEYILTTLKMLNPRLNQIRLSLSTGHLFLILQGR